MSGERRLRRYADRNESRWLSGRMNERGEIVRRYCSKRFCCFPGGSGRNTVHEVVGSGVV